MYVCVCVYIYNHFQVKYSLNPHKLPPVEQRLSHTVKCACEKLKWKQWARVWEVKLSMFWCHCEELCGSRRGRHTSYRFIHASESTTLKVTFLSQRDRVTVTNACSDEWISEWQLTSDLHDSNIVLWAVHKSLSL